MFRLSVEAEPSWMERDFRGPLWAVRPKGSWEHSHCPSPPVYSCLPPLPLQMAVSVSEGGRPKVSTSSQEKAAVSHSH